MKPKQTKAKSLESNLRKLLKTWDKEVKRWYRAAEQSKKYSDIYDRCRARAFEISICRRALADLL